MLRPNTFALTLLLASLTALGPMSSDMYVPSLPDIGHSLHVPIAQVQLTISSYLIGFASRSDYLRADLRPPRPQAGPAGGDLRLRPRQRAMRDDAIDRRADCGALRAGAWRGRRHRAGACGGARPLFRRACRARTIADGIDPGLRADCCAAHRRRPADRIRLACEFHPAGDCLDRVGHGDRAASP